MKASPPQPLENVYWLGGTSGSAKSTIANRIAAEHNMVLYSSDAVMGDHAKRCRPEECPMLESFKQMTMDERWVDRSPQTMYETFHWFHGEAFQHIIEDLVSMPRTQRIIVEGFRLLPRLVKPWMPSPQRAIWCISTPEFRLKAFTERGTLWDIPNKTTHPKKALENQLAREEIFSARLVQECEKENVKMLMVDGIRSEADLVSCVSAYFGLQAAGRTLART